jgi:hypothetical protein
MFWKALLFVLLVLTTCHGADRRRRVSHSGVSHHLAVIISAPLQVIAQQRADAMARQGILSHSIGGCPTWSGRGVGEGIGCSSANDPKSVATCIVGSTVVADAHCRSSNGLIYRVRFFK